MSENSRDKGGIDWWQKPDHLKQGDKSTPRKRKPKSTSGSDKESTRGRVKERAKSDDTPQERRSLGWFMLRIVKHVIFVAILATGAGFGAHYALYYGTRHGVQCEVPQFKYEHVDRARELALGDELRVVVNDSLYAPMYGPGVVLDQLPVAGTIVKPGRAIYVTINAMHRRIVDVPYVAGRSLRQAKNMLEMVGFEIGELIYEPDLAPNYVLSQYCNGERVTAKSDIKAPLGNQMVLHIGLGEMSEVIVPDLMGRTIYEAKQDLWDVGLNLDSLTYHEDIPIDSIKYAQVMRQSIEEQSMHPLGTKISIKVTSRPYMVDSMRRERVREKIRREEELVEMQRIQDSIDMMSVDTFNLYKQMYQEFGTEEQLEGLMLLDTLSIYDAMEIGVIEEEIKE